MSKTKRKAKQQNFLNYFLNEFVFFRRDFSFETHLSIEKTKEKLQNLAYEKQGCWRQQGIIVKVFYSNSFEIRKVNSLANPQMLANATGVIFADEDTGLTVVEGSISIDGFVNLLMILVILPLSLGLSIFLFGIGEPYQQVEFRLLACMFATSIASIFLIRWKGMFRDRNYLFDIIENATTSKKSKVSA